MMSDTVLFLLSFLLLSILVIFWAYRNHTAAEILKKKTENYRQIIEQANDAMLVIDIVDGKILESNPGAAKLLGYLPEKLQSSTLFDLHPKEYLEKSSAIVADVWEKGGLIYKDIPFVNSSGELLPVECSAKVTPFAGRPAIVIYARDIRERLRLEREVLEQKEIIEQKNKDITDSINYARRIQQAILPEEKEIKKIFRESFVLYRPKDIVSGDFFWFTHLEKNGQTSCALAAADCTGHGVPGAFMSMIGCSSLNEIIVERKILQPSLILEQLNECVIKILKQTGDDGQTRDGMDIGICVFHPDPLRVEFSGANRPLLIVRDKNLIEVRGEKQPIGGGWQGARIPYVNHTIPLQSGDLIYLFTDGYADQFGGKEGKKFMTKRFKELLVEMSDRSMDEQKKLMSSIVDEWRNSREAEGIKCEQVDDILVIGLKCI